MGSTLHFYKSSRGISFHMENIGKSLLSLDMYINHVLLICPLAHQGPGRHIWITKLVMILYPSLTEQTPPKNESKYKEFLWRKLIWSHLQNIIRFSGLTQYGQYHGCEWAVDKGIGAPRYNAGIMSAMASQITNLTIVCWAFIKAQLKENIKAPRHWPLCGEFTGNRWIPNTKGQ